MFGDGATGGDPDSVVRCDMSEEADKASNAARTANETIVDGNRHEVRIVGTLGAPCVEAVDHIFGELAGG